MPPRPSHRLDVLLVPPDDEEALEAVRQLRDAFQQREFLDGEAPGAKVEALVRGGFVRARIDNPGERVLYANQQGGFHAQCGACDAPVARQFDPLGTTICSACGHTMTVDQVRCRPEVAVARAALVLSDVGDAFVQHVPEGWRRIWRRVSA